MAIILFDKDNKDSDASILCSWVKREYGCEVKSKTLNIEGDTLVQFTNCKGLPNGLSSIYLLCEFLHNGVYTVKIIWDRQVNR